MNGHVFKFAYARGVQHALVNSGAIAHYKSAEDADEAAEMAAAEMAEDLDATEPVEEDGTAEVAAKLVELSNAAEQTAQSAEETSAIAAEAANAVASLKAASDIGATGGGTGSPNDLLAAATVTEEGAEENLKRGPEYAHTPPAPQEASAMQGVQSTHPGAPTAADQTKGAGVILDGKTAAAILRKLAGGDTDIGETGGGTDVGASVSALGAPLDAPAETHEEAKKRPDDYANVNPPVTQPSAMTGEEGAHPGSPTGDTLEGRESTAAFNFLLRKTASEVAPYLPAKLGDIDKLAAIRTMIGMTGPERANYIARLTKAAEAAEEEEAAPAAKSPEVEAEAAEKSAEAILRKLGLGA